MAKKAASAQLGLRVGPPSDEMKWRAKDALSTLTRAAEIQKDKALMRAVKTEARQQVKAISATIKPRKR